MSNYEIAKARTASLFLTYDLPAMIQKTGFQADEDYIYMDFARRKHRISLQTGLVEFLAGAPAHGHDLEAGDPEAGYLEAGYLEADYNVAMTIYDIICYSDAQCSAAGQFTAMQNLAPMFNASRGSSSFAGEGMFGSLQRLFDSRPEKLEAACKALGGTPFGKGDVSYRIPIFSYHGDIDIVLDFWCSDDEFPAQLTILCDENLLQYMHYETMWFMVGHLTGRIKELMEIEINQR